MPWRGEWLRVLQDFAHAPAFGCIAVAALVWIRTSRASLSNRPAQYVLAFVIAVVLGGLTELAQFVVKRDPSWFDLRSDAFGAAAFLGIAAAFDSHLRRWLRPLGAVIAVLLLIAHSMPALTMLRAYERRASAFPTLVDFSDQRDLYFLREQWSGIAITSLPSAYARSPGEAALHVTFLPGDWPGVDDLEPAPDWRGYQALALDVVNPTDEPLWLTLRAHDVHHNFEFTDRFTRRFNVPPRTRSTLRIPIAEIASAPRGRAMDLHQMADFLFFRSSDSLATEMYLVSVRLEK